MNTLHYISNDKFINAKLVAYFEKSDIRFISYDRKQSPKLQAVLIVEPFKLIDEYFNIHTIWKSFLEKNGNSPNVKMLVSGFGQLSIHPNYVDLFTLPNDFDRVLMKAKPISENWEIETNQFNIVTRLRAFFKGHNTISLFQKLNSLEMSVKNIDFAINGTINKNFEEAAVKIVGMSQDQWKNFMNRWANYKKFFRYSPFYYQEKAINEALDQVRPFFESRTPDASLFIEVECAQKISEIRNHLIKMDQYVRPEIYS